VLLELPVREAGARAVNLTELPPPERFRPTCSPVRTLMLLVTYACNLRCTYCFVEKEPRRMPAEVARKAVEWFLAHPVSGSEYRPVVSFFGGEPFLEVERMVSVLA
jgi:sulfatase maturation enzyme AslB (radical SAM superfamily)